MNQSTSQIPYSWVEKLFANMSMMYGNKMDWMFNGMDKGQVMTFWHMKLEDMSREEFTRGVKALDRQDAPPTLPQFVKLCRPDINFTSAYHEAVRGTQARREGKKGTWSHPAIFWASAELSHDLLNMSQHQIEGRWREALSRQLEKSKWAEIPEVFTPIEYKASTVSKEEARERIKNIGIDMKSQGDESWIYRGLERMKNGWNPPAGVKEIYRLAMKAKGIKG